MKQSIIIINCIFVGCYTLNVHSAPNQPSLMNAHYTPHFNLAPMHTELNTDIPPAVQLASSSHNGTISTTTEGIILEPRGIPRLFVLSANKYAVLKAVLKKKSYGLNYTRKW